MLLVRNEINQNQRHEATISHQNQPNPSQTDLFLEKFDQLLNVITVYFFDFCCFLYFL